MSLYRLKSVIICLAEKANKYSENKWFGGFLEEENLIKRLHFFVGGGVFNDYLFFEIVYYFSIEKNNRKLKGGALWYLLLIVRCRVGIRFASHRFITFGSSQK